MNPAVTPRLLAFHHAMKAAILLGFAIYIADLVRTENILYYIAPRMVDYVKWSAFAFYAIGIHQSVLAFRALSGKPDACDCGDHDHTPSTSVWKNALIYGLFAAPLLLGFVLPDVSMGSSLAAKKGMNLSSSAMIRSGAAAESSPSGPPSAAASANNVEAAGTLTDSELKRLFPYDKFTESYAKQAMSLYRQDMIRIPENAYIETLTAVDLYTDQFVGKRLEITGFVFRVEPMTDNQFVVGRFAVQCCSADAAPYGVLAEYANAKAFADDTWVKASGTIQKTKFNDMDIMKLNIEKIEKTTAPKTQYVYPN
jgi:uncharacterized repeat protein (TIGR03943 family)